MILFNVKIALRNLLKHKTFSFINLFGLIIGFASAIFIMLYVQNELSYDRFHQDADRIYRLDAEFHFNNFGKTIPYTSPGLVQYLGDNDANVQASTKILDISRPILFDYNNQQSFENDVIFADKDFLKVFSFKLLEGNPATVLKEPNDVILDKEIAKKYFGNENPVGKFIKISYQDTTALFKITGIIENVPSNSSLKYSAICSYLTIDSPVITSDKQNWMNLNIKGYVKLSDTSYADILNNTMEPLSKKILGGDAYYRPFVQPITDIHLNQMGFDLPQEGSINNLIIYSALALLMLLIAAINYTNLITSNAATRGKEIGVKKILGAKKNLLVKQFLSETILFCLIALTLAILVVELLLPLYNDILNTDLKLTFINDPVYLFSFIAVVLLTGVVSGSYPALYISGFRTIDILKKNTDRKYGRGGLRKALVVIQFTGSIIILIITFGIQQQLKLFDEKDLGFNKENVLILPFRNYQLADRTDELKNELKKLPEVKGVSVSQGFPSPGSSNTIRLQTKEGEIKPVVHMEAVDDGFAGLLNLKILEGRWFSEKYPTDVTDGLVVNQKFVEKYRLTNPIGMKINNGKIIGVVNNFNYTSLKVPIEPIIFWHYKRSKHWIFYANQAAVKLAHGFSKNTIENIHKVWKEIYPGVPFEYNTLTDLYKKNYESEKKFGEIIAVFTLIGLLTACLGLFAISLFTTERRSKEIGIRKILGATVNSIVLLVSREYLKLVIVANIIAIPVAYFLLNNWLNNFATRINLTTWLFLSTAILSIVIAFFTISFQSIRAALTNPINVLKSE